MTNLVTKSCVVTFLALGAFAPRAMAQTLAQRLVREMVEQHPDILSALEIAITGAKGCVTVASTDPKDVGEKCDADELAPMRTGEPDVEAPTKDDPVYD